MSGDSHSAARLVVSGPGRADSVDCRHGMVIGRSPEADLQLPDPDCLISRRHATLTQSADGRWRIADSGSRNGLMVNGQPTPAGELRHNDTIELGLYRLIFVDDIGPEPGGELVHGGTTTVTLRGQPLDNVRFGGVDGPASLNREQLGIVQRLLSALAGQPTEADVAARSCRTLCDLLGADVGMLLFAETGSADPEIRLIDRHLGEPVAEHATQDIGVSRTLVAKVVADGRPAMADAGEASGGDLQVSRARWSERETVLCARAETTDRGQVLVYIVFLDRRPPDEAVDLLGLLAQQVGLALTGARAQEQVRRHAVIQHELSTARRIQLHLLPPVAQRFGDLQTHIHYQPCDEVGGDYVDAWSLADGRVVCVLADVSGHGLASALIMTSVHTAIRNCLAFYDDLARAIERVNDGLVAHTPANKFVTLAALSVDPATGAFELVSGGHPPPIHLTAAGEGRLLEFAGGMPLGIAAQPLPCYRGQLDPGEAILLYSDGIQETLSPTGRMLGIEGLRRWTIDHADAITDPAAMLGGIQAMCDDWRDGGDVTDDQSLLLVRRLD